MLLLLGQAAESLSQKSVLDDLALQYSMQEQ